MDNSTPSARGPTWSPLVILLCAYGFIALITPIMVSETESQAPMIGGVFIGAVSGQAGFLAIWAAMGPYRLRVRWALVLLLSVLLYWALFAGSALTGRLGAGGFREMGAGMLVLPLVFLTLQVPLWLFRFLSGWRVVVRGGEDTFSRSGARQFGILHVMGVTAAVAIALASFRLLMMAGDFSEYDMQLVWLRMGIICLMAIVYSAVWTLPCLWAGFAARDAGKGIAVVGGLCAVVTTVVVLIFSVTTGRGPTGVEVMAYFSVHFSLAAVLLGSLHVARLSGWVLWRVNGQRHAADPISDVTVVPETDSPPPEADAG